jgi:hypothetical protein
MNRIVRLGRTPDFIQDAGGFECGGTPRAVIGRAGGAVLRVDVAADDHVLVGFVGAGDAGNSRASVGSIEASGK